MRTETSFSNELALTGIESLAPVSGRQIELLGEFTVASGTCGFNFLKSGSKQVSLTYDADSGNLTLDMTSLDRTVNDGVYGGIYSVALPKKVALGEKLKLHVYLDGSIADIFVNDTWAYSVRIFPNDAAAVGAEVFATNQMQAHIEAWTLNAGYHTTDIKSPKLKAQSSKFKVYDLQGRHLNVVPQKSIYINNGKKYVSR
jgi:beta-fructofuranosidase